jgi:hypothetical protein
VKGVDDAILIVLVIVLLLGILFPTIILLVFTELFLVGTLLVVVGVGLNLNLGIEGRVFFAL